MPQIHLFCIKHPPTWDERQIIRRCDGWMTCPDRSIHSRLTSHSQIMAANLPLDWLIWDCQGFPRSSGIQLALAQRYLLSLAHFWHLHNVPPLRLQVLTTLSLLSSFRTACMQGGIGANEYCINQASKTDSIALRSFGIFTQAGQGRKGKAKEGKSVANCRRHGDGKGNAGHLINLSAGQLVGIWFNSWLRGGLQTCFHFWAQART